jgi:hypothetical protein
MNEGWSVKDEVSSPAGDFVIDCEYNDVSSLTSTRSGHYDGRGPTIAVGLVGLTSSVPKGRNQKTESNNSQWGDPTRHC